jgi:hypothetical protein
MDKHRTIFDKSIFGCPDKGKISMTVGISPRLKQHTSTTPKRVEYPTPVISDRFNHFVVGEPLFSLPWAVCPRLFRFSHFVAKDLINATYQHYPI